MKTLDYPPLGAHALHLMRRACLIVCRIPGRAQHFTIIPQIYKELFLHIELSFQRRLCMAWMARKWWRNAPKFRFAWFKISDDNIPWAIKTWRQPGQPGPANDATLPTGTKNTEKCKYLQQVSEWVNCVQVWLHWQDFCWGRVGPEPVNLS